MARKESIAAPSRAVPLAVLALLAYLPLLLTSPGMVEADTKAYLYLDPGRLLSSALSMWDPSVAAGTVTHQQIGYLLPQGPFYWALAEVHVPVWVAQRLWLGTLVFAAGAGVWYLARLLGLGLWGRRPPPSESVSDMGAGGSPARRPARAIRAVFVENAGPLSAGLVYMFSPYLLQYAWRTSALVLPWAGLGWMLGFTVLAVRRGGWRYPCLFALVVALVGATNATSLLYVGLGPALYILYAVLGGEEASWRRGLAALGRLAGLSLAVSLWWVAGLWVEAAYGLDVLKFTETVPTIAATSAPAEVLRGLGYWLFYGGSPIGPWVPASKSYETDIWLLTISFVIPALALLAAALVRWRHRIYFVGLVLVGLVLSVGAFPLTGPGAIGTALRAFLTETTVGSALRSTDRATPLVVLGTAMLLGSGVTAAVRRGRVAGLATAFSVALLAVLNAVPLLGGAAVESAYDAPAKPPAYMQQAANILDSAGDSTRVLFEPGENFAVYDFGTTNDSVWPGLMTRPTIQRWQVVDGGAATADLLAALDLTIQQGTYEPSTLAPIARLLSAGDVVLQSNLAYWWYLTPAPEVAWQEFADPPAGIGSPIDLGPPTAGDPPANFADDNESVLALPPDAKAPPALAIFPVEGARPIYRAEPATSPLVVDGSGAGLVAAAATGILDDNPTIVYSASFDGDAQLAGEALTPSSQLVVTDSNGKVLRRWNNLQGDIGAVETAGTVPTVSDPSAVPLVVFPNAASSAYTTAVYSDAAYVTASDYDNPSTFRPEDAAYSAFDGDTSTSWQIDPDAALGSWIEVKLEKPVVTDHINLVQHLYPGDGRFVTEATLTFDGGHPLRVALDGASRTPAGQTVTFPTRGFKTLRITIDALVPSAPRRADNNVGFAEIRIPGVHIGEALALPTDLLSRLGPASLGHRLTVIVSRDRVSPASDLTDPEPDISRIFALPTARAFTVSGTARLSSLLSDADIDRLIGISPELKGAVLSSDSRLGGDVAAGAQSAFDGDPSTAWVPAFGPEIGAWVQMSLPRPVSFDHLDLQIVADGRHSVPTRLLITTNQGVSHLVRIPPIRDRAKPGATVSVTVRFPRITGRVVRFQIAAVRPVVTPYYHGGGGKVLPVGIAELGVPGVRFGQPDPATPLPDSCRTNLLRIDGTPVGVRLVGTVGEAESLSGLEVVGCGDAASGVTLPPGTNTIETAPGLSAGFDLDRVVLDSAPGGGPMPLGPGGSTTPAPGTLSSQGSPALATPAVRVLSSSASTASVRVSGASAPFWLVLGQSQNAGWAASIAGGANLGSSQLIDGMANGWYVRPPAGGRPFVVDLRFAPQSYVWLALGVSAVGLGACLVVICSPLWPGLRLRRRRRRASRDDPAVAEVAPEAGAVPADDPPQLENPLDAGGKRPTPVVIAVLSIALGLLASALPVPPWGPPAGAAVAALVALALVFPRARVLLRGAVVVCAVGIVLDVTIHQGVAGLSANSGWPLDFPLAETLTWLAVAALVADVVVERATDPSRQPPKQPSRP